MPKEEAHWLLAHPRCTAWVQDRIAAATQQPPVDRVAPVAPRDKEEPQEPRQRPRNINALRAQAHGMCYGWQRRAAGKKPI